MVPVRPSISAAEVAMRLALLPALLSLASVAPAQAVAPSTGTVTLQSFTGLNCPVSLSAYNANVGDVVETRSRTPLPQQTYSLTLAPSSSRTIVAARLTLHGLAGAQVMPALHRRQQPTGATESITVAPATVGDRLYHATLYAQKLTGVQWIELTRLIYADGSEWHTSSKSVCRVVPDGFRLVAAGD